MTMMGLETTAQVARLLTRLPWFGPRLLFRAERRFSFLSVDGWESLIEAITDAHPDVVSLDVFDTCIVRRLAGDQPIENAIDHRVRVADGTSSGSRAAVADALERELCRAVPGAVEALRRVRKITPNVVFLSDTDRSSALLVEILRSQGLFVDGDRLVASCETGTTKARGDLFLHEDYRQALDEVAAKNGSVGTGGVGVWHVGNHIWSDGVMAIKAGLTGVVFAEAEPNRYEETMGRRPSSAGAALAAAARTARLTLETQGSEGLLDGRDAEARKVGASVGGPALTAFVLWVAERCRAQNLGDVVFLARDGELPLELAKTIPADHWQGRSLHYLHCSRLTWSLAAASAVGVDEWIAVGCDEETAFLLNRRHLIPLSALVDRVGLTVEDFGTTVTGHAELAALDFSKPLPVGSAHLWSSLLADPEVRRCVSERSNQRRDLILDYLRADGFPTGPIALVDVGWRGRLAWQVSAVLRNLVEVEPIHLHFGGDKVHADVDAAIPIERFAFDGYQPPKPVTAPVSCVETLTASGKARVVEYRRAVDGSVKLVFGRAHSEVTDGDRVELWAGALAMASGVPSRAELESWGISPTALDAEVRDLLGQWWNTPTPAEARALAALMFEHDEAGTRFRPLVAPYGLGELVRSEREPRQWAQGSEAVTPQPMRAIIGPLRFARSAFRRVASPRL